MEKSKKYRIGNWHLAHADYKYAENGSEDSASLSASHHEVCEYLILMELRMNVVGVVDS